MFERGICQIFFPYTVPRPWQSSTDLENIWRVLEFCPDQRRGTLGLVMHSISTFATQIIFGIKNVIIHNF